MTPIQSSQLVQLKNSAQRTICIIFYKDNYMQHVEYKQLKIVKRTFYLYIRHNKTFSILFHIRSHSFCVQIIRQLDVIIDSISPNSPTKVTRACTNFKHHDTGGQYLLTVQNRKLKKSEHRMAFEKKNYNPSVSKFMLFNYF